MFGIQGIRDKDNEIECLQIKTTKIQIKLLTIKMLIPKLSLENKRGQSSNCILSSIFFSNNIPAQVVISLFVNSILSPFYCKIFLQEF
jgi:hypothetical protein